LRFIELDLIIQKYLKVFASTLTGAGFVVNDPSYFFIHEGGINDISDVSIILKEGQRILGMSIFMRFLEYEFLIPGPAIPKNTLHLRELF
jgi:hypothetical protein